ncbi:MAG: hypothetical protein ACW981_15075 [Candidatus Hodarchaeales archaeon]|jgi:hypothetical protein
MKSDRIGVSQMKKQEIAFYAIYSLLIGLYSISIRFFFYGLEISDIIAKQQAINLSGLVLLMAIAITFNMILIKGIFEIKNLEHVKN